MDGAWGWVVTAVGGLVVLIGLRDVFKTLWHPTGSGWLSSHLMSAVWRLTRSRRQRGRSGVLSGPTALVLVMAAWVMVLVLGFALVYWPHLPDGFVLSSDLDRSERGGWLDALYTSTVTLATLGFGDVTPAADWLRIVVPVQALLGFALLTAGVTWVLQIYPALSRRRALALQLSGLRRVGVARFVGAPEGWLPASVVATLADDVVRIRVDVTQYSETYYFRDGDDDASLAAVLTTAWDLQHAARDAPREDVRIAGQLLEQSVHDLAKILDDEFLQRGGSVAEVLDAFAADHGHQALGRD
ncbi:MULTISPECIES: potassium channel family protein [unclassified Modestobacter]